MKKTLVVGASLKPDRYSFKAINALSLAGHPVVAFGLKEGLVADVNIQKEWNFAADIDTVTMYVNPQRQKELYDKIITLNPKRVIFNPGTENSEFEVLLATNKIETEQACTLVLLSIDQY
jgi:predicted CoA-binding protein